MDILLNKSLINCHALGVDSLVLKEGPNMIRMFVARPEHTLWRNALVELEQYMAPFSVALHQHHCDVTLQPILGEIHNVVEDPEGLPYLMYPYRFTSHILAGRERAGFQPLNLIGKSLNLSMEKLTGPRFMKASERHSVHVPQGKVAAWYIWEGRENPNHDSTIYTNDPKIETFDFSLMDLPMTEERLREDLAIIGVMDAR